MQKRVMENEKIEVLFEHNAVGLYGDNGVEGVHLVKRMGETDEQRYDLAIDGFFLAIGHKPNSDIFKPYVDTDRNGLYTDRTRYSHLQRFPECLQREMLPTLITVRPSQRQLQDVWQRLRRKDSC